MDAGSSGDVHLLMATFVDGATAGAILLAMALGLSLPKLLLEGLVPTLAGLPKE
jgi:thiol:disulfide interchange protein